MPAFLSDGDTPNKTDSRWKILQKILGASTAAGGGLTVGAGAPTGATATSPPFYWDSTGSFLYVWDGAAWNIH